MLYHFLLDPPPPLCYFLLTGERLQGRRTTENGLVSVVSAGRRIAEGLKCSSVPARALAEREGGVGGGVGVIRWFQSWSDPGGEKRVTDAPASRFSEASRAAFHKHAFPVAAEFSS